MMMGQQSNINNVEAWNGANFPFGGGQQQQQQQHGWGPYGTGAPAPAGGVYSSSSNNTINFASAVNCQYIAEKHAIIVRVGAKGWRLSDANIGEAIKAWDSVITASVMTATAQPSNPVSCFCAELDVSMNLLGDVAVEKLMSMLGRRSMPCKVFFFVFASSKRN